MRKNQEAYFRDRLGLTLLTLLFWGAYGCGGQTSTDAKSPAIGVILSESGPTDFIGIPERQVLEGLLQDYTQTNQNIHDLTLTFRDSAGDPNQALSLFQRFCENQNIVAVIGPSTSGESIPVANEASKCNLPLLSLAASKQIVKMADGSTNRWVFKFAQNDNLAAKRLVRALTQDQRKSAVLLFSEDGFGKSGALEFRSEMEEAAILLALDMGFPSAIESAAAYAAAIPKESDAVVIWGTSPGPALLAKAIRRSRSDIALYFSHGNASEQFIQSAGAAVEGATIIGSRVLTPSNYLDSTNPSAVAIARYQAFWTKRGLPGLPSHFGGHARDALEALIACFPKDASQGEDAAARRVLLRNQLEQLTNFHGVTGTFNFSETDHAGLDASSFETYRIINGTFKPLA